MDYIIAPQNDGPSKFLGICVFWLIGGALFFWKFGRLKRVSIEGEQLYVSNYLKEIQLKTNEIEDIREANFWINSPRKIIISLKSRSDFGKVIEFTPKVYSGPLVIDELNGIMELAGSTTPVFKTR